MSSYVAPRPNKFYPARPQTGSTAQPTRPPAAPGEGGPLPAPVPKPAEPGATFAVQPPPGPAGPYAGPGTGTPPVPTPAGPPPAAPATDVDTHPDATKPSGDPWIDTLRQQAKGKSEDFLRFGNDTLIRWKPYYDEAESKKAGRPRFRSMRGAEGFFDKPTECPPGSGPSGPNETDPCKPHGGGGPGGGFGPEGGPGGPFGGGQGWGLTQEEKDYLAAMTGLAGTMKSQSERLFGVGMPAYLQTTEHWKKLMGAYGRGGIEAALGPAREQAAETYAGARAQLRGLRGAERAQAEAELAQGSAGTIARMPAELQTSAAMGLQQSAEYGVSTGLQSETQAAGLYGAAQEAVGKSRLTEEGYAVQQWIANLQAKTSWKIASLQADVSREQLAFEKEQASQLLAQRAYEFEQSYKLQREQLEAQIDEWMRQYSSGQSAQKGQLIGAGIGAAALIGVALI